MAPAIFSLLQNLWPFSIRKSDDLKLSNQFVQRLLIPEYTKQFVFAAQEPDSNAVVYILAAQNLSQQSAFDAENLIKEVKPTAVVAQVAISALPEIQTEEKSLRSDQPNNVPTSSFGVIRGCLIDKINKEKYDNFAGFQVLREIFGIGFYGHLLAAKKAAKEVDSYFLLLESPYESVCSVQQQSGAKSGDKNSGVNLQTSCLVPGKVVPVIYSTSRRFYVTDPLQSQVVKLLIPSLESLLRKTILYDSVSEAKPGECPSRCDDYQAPPFAQSVYPLLADLHEIFNDLPAVRKAMISAQKIIADVNKGEPVDAQLLSQVYSFRVAVEGLRIALNSAARYPAHKMANSKSTSLEFSELPSEEKCHVLFAQAIKSQVKKFGGPVVAIVDASSLAGLRKHWSTPVPSEVAVLADQCFTHDFNNNDNVEEIVTDKQMDKKKLLADKPMVAVGAGATAVIGASSLSKAVPASTLVKFATYKVPASLKFGLAHLQRQACFGLSKILGPSKLLAPGVASAGAKTSTTLKLTASAEKIRAITHSMIASAERTSLLAIRTSFYEIMRGRGVGKLKFAPLATFGCSVSLCTGLLVYGDGIECVAESIPSVPTIATLGRGLLSLQQASQEVRQTTSTKLQEAVQSLIYNMNKK